METIQSRKNILFYEICRLCLENCGSCTISDSNDLIKKIYRCTGLKISPTDNLPQEICTPCLDIVNKASELRKIALKNDEHLKTLFKEDKESQPEHDIMKEKDIESQKSQQHNNVNSTRLIKVRRDLFSTNNEASPTSSKEQDESHKTKRRKKNDNSSFDNECTVSSQFNEENAALHTKVKTIDRNGRTEYECTICSKVYDKWKKVYLHMRSHNKTIVCPLDACGKKFATKGDLERHIRAHTGEKPFKCDECDKSFTQSGSLKQHKLNVHSLLFS